MRASTNYSHDRPFTDFVHINVAMPKIYEPLGWEEIDLPDDEKERLDIDDSIDYTLKDERGIIKTVQERFRDNFYGDKYNDVTFRYMREFNPHVDRRQSEFFKIKAEFFLYGITNGSKYRYQKEVTDFTKYCLFRVKPLIGKIESGEIVIDDKLHKGKIVDGKLTIPHNYNRDGSSSFIAFDIPSLNELWPDEIVIEQKGFY